MEPISTKTESCSDKMARECALLAGAAQKIGDGICNAAQDAWKNPERNTKMMGDAAVGGLAIALLAKNPAILGKELQPLCEFGLAHGGKIGAACFAVDLSQRTANPLIDTWHSSERLSANKLILADKLGSAFVDYTLMGAAGLAGAKYGPGALSHVRNFAETNWPSQQRYAYAFSHYEQQNFPGSLKRDQFADLEKPAEKPSVYYNLSGPREDGIHLTGKTHVLRSDWIYANGQPGDVVLHHPGSGQNYIGAKLLDCHQKLVAALTDFDLKDIFHASKVNFCSTQRRNANIDFIREAIAQLRGNLTVKREFGHHEIANPVIGEQYRLRNPMWLDSSRQAPNIELPLTGRVYKFDSDKPEPGDLIVKPELHQQRKQGFGPQSGQFALMGYDKCLFAQKFDLRRFLIRDTDLSDPFRLFYFDSQTDMNQKFPLLVKTIRANLKQSDIAVWNHDSKGQVFEISRKR